MPWLHAITDWMDEWIAAGQSAVITCSALKRSYRDQLLTGRPAATMVFLQVSRAVLEQRLTALLVDLGIARVAKSKAFSLSGGERRRVEISRALVISPSFILLDEPFAGIDPIAVVDIQGIVTQLKERGIGVLITDHNVRETLGICDRAYIQNEGTVLEEGVPAHIAASRRAREIYLGEKFRL